MVNLFVDFLCAEICIGLQYDCVADSVLGVLCGVLVGSECFMWMNLEHCVVLLCCAIF